LDDIEILFISGYATAGPKGESGPSGRDGKKIKINQIELFLYNFAI
jgi:hypothetical protein